MNNIWFTSDEHFGHANIIKFCNRPFANIEETREAIIENHNKLVKPGDLVYHLGDMFWRTTPLEEARSIRLRLTGQHYYIFGNHEELIQHNKNLSSLFIWCRETENLRISGYPNIWLSHYAHRVWNGSHQGAYHLYGHTHAVLPEDGSLSFDVGVDAQDYKPISLEQVHEKMQLKLLTNGEGKFSCICGQSFTDKYRAMAICNQCGKNMDRA